MSHGDAVRQKARILNTRKFNYRGCPCFVEGQGVHVTEIVHFVIRSTRVASHFSASIGTWPNLAREMMPKRREKQTSDAVKL